MSTASSDAGSNRSNETSAPENTNGDVISNMPECIISHILSSLPTKEAVRTSVLSKAWEFKWTSIYNIHVVHHREIRKSFVEFMDRLLTHSQYTKSFRLAWRGYCDHTCIENWLSSVFIRNVESVAIHGRPSLQGPGKAVLPHSLLSCTSLKELIIELYPCTLKVPAIICFPNLTRLHLRVVQIYTETDTVRFNLPVLRKCDLRCIWPLNVNCIDIYAPALTSFVSCANYIEDCKDYAKLGNYTIKIDPGVKLAYFGHRGEFLENFLLAGSQVVTATLEDDDYKNESFVKCKLRFRKLLNEFSSIEELNLSCLAAQAIAQTKRELPLRKYDKLVRLNLYRSCSSRGNHHATYDGLLELLHAAPYLKFLDVHVSSVLSYSSDGAYDFDAGVSVPSCIVSHLEEVTLSGLTVDRRYRGLAEFLLKHGSELKKFSVSFREEFKSEVENMLGTLPKRSPCVVIVTKIWPRPIPVRLLSNHENSIS